MSHEATNWVSNLRGLPPELRVVLWYLCDCHNPAHGGSFPSQRWLSERCEIKPSTLNRYLKALEQRGFIVREQRVHPVSRKRESTRYHFPFEHDFHAWAKNPSPDLRDGEGPETDSQIEEKPSPKIDENRLPKWESNPVRESVRESVKESPPAREPDEDNPKRLAERYKALEIGRHGNPWPDVLAKSSEWGLRQFTRLSPEDRKLAEERRDAYLAACPKVASGERKGQPAAAPLGVYLRDRKFVDIEAIAPRLVRNEPATLIDFPPFGPVWGAVRMLFLLDGPEDFEIADDLRETVRTVFETRRRVTETGALAYLRRKGIALGPGDTLVFPDDFEADERRRRAVDQGFPKVNALHAQASARQTGKMDRQFGALAALMEAVPVASAVFEAWRGWHAENYLPFVPDPGAQPVVWFPKGGPMNIQEFERLARSIMTKETNHEN